MSSAFKAQRERTPGWGGQDAYFVVSFRKKHRAMLISAVHTPIYKTYSSPQNHDTEAGESRMYDSSSREEQTGSAGLRSRTVWSKYQPLASESGMPSLT